MRVPVLDCLVVGAGPAGLQLGHHLASAGRDYLILEAGAAPGTFFTTYPRHRQLISINKVHTGTDDPELNLRMDWRSVATGRSWPISKAVGGAVLFAAVLVWIVRPLLQRYFGRPNLPESSVVLATLAVLFLAAWYTDEIGLYAVFGAFSIGAAMPQIAAVTMTEPTTNAITRVCVPMFFSYSGLNTRFGLLTDSRVLVFAIGAIVAAVASKFGGCWLAARLRGESSTTAAQIGVLMNARGLMQLIALNIGVQAHLVTDALFTSLVLVALVTTMMTAPLLALIDRRAAPSPAEPVPARLSGGI